MELKDLIFLGACSLLTAEVEQSGFGLAEKRVENAVRLAQAVWQAVCEANI